MAALLDELKSLMQRIPEKTARPRTNDKIEKIRGAVFGAIFTLRNYVYERRFIDRHEAWIELFGVTIGDDIDTVIEKVTRHLATLCL